MSNDASTRKGARGLAIGAGASETIQRSSQAAGGRTIYLNPVSGHDANTGTRNAPLRTLAAAAARVNAAGEPGATTVILDEGIYAVWETALFKPSRPYSKTERLTIRAAVLPDDPDWHQGRMPTLIHQQRIASMVTFRCLLARGALLSYP